MAKKFILDTKSRHLIIFLQFLLISSLAHLKFMAQGRVLLIHKSVTVTVSDTTQQGRNEESLVMIGSRPPRCDKKCVAIQVPIVPSIKPTKSNEYLSIQYSRGDDISNYKPICWKCKCGHFIYNP